MDNIAIDCTNHDDNQKICAQEAFFKMGFKWGSGAGYQYLNAYGYAVDGGKLTFFTRPLNDDIKEDFNHLKFLTLAELFALAKGNHRVMEYCKSPTTKTDRSKPRNKYDREILPGVFVDVYDVLSAFKTDSPAVDHAVKKLLAPGKRGHKDRVTDLKEAIASIESEIAKINEWSK